MSEETAQAIDQDPQNSKEAETTATYSRGGDELHALAQALLDYEVLDDELHQILAGQSLEREPIPSVSERGFRRG